MSIAWTLLWCCLAIPSWEDEPKPETKSPVQQRLTAASLAWDRANDEVGREHTKLAAAGLSTAEQTVQSQAIEDRWAAAITPSFHDLVQVAASQPHDPAAVAGLGFVALNARGLPTDEARGALIALQRDHVRAPDISTATRTFFVQESRPEAIALMRAVLAANPSRTERGRVCEDLAWTLQWQAERIERVRAGGSQKPLPAHLQAADPAALRGEAMILYDRCVAELADVPVVGFGAGKTVGEFATGALVNLRQLEVGKPAPEITGTDVDGQPLRLSSYRGQAVVLIFSGEWCGPCRGNAPFLRDLLTPAAQQRVPCVVLEVNSDSTPEPLRKAIAAGEITWPCWFDGGTTGPITMAWGNTVWPFLYVLDAQGVIRAKDVHCEAVAGIVADVVAGREPRSKP